MTAAGTILGTAAYMSPEQARGKAVDRRADIWAFGVVLFEVLTGERLFEGETVSDTLAAVLRAEPDWSALPASQAPVLVRIVERCLVRDPRLRLRDIGEVRILLQSGDTAAASLFGATASAVPAASSGRRGVPAVLVVVLALLAALAGGWIGSSVLTSSSEPPLLHASIPPLPGTRIDLNASSPGPGMLSPDGRMIAFTARDEAGVTRLYLRHLDRAEPVAVSGTENAAYPFWSPDGSTAAVEVYGESQEGVDLWQVDLGNGLRTRFTFDPANEATPVWSPDGSHVYYVARADTGSRVLRRAVDGTVDAEELWSDDAFLRVTDVADDESHLLLSREDEAGTMADVVVLPLDGSGEPADVLVGEQRATAAVYSPDGRWIA